jgi:hypothetical protein
MHHCFVHYLLFCNLATTFCNKEAMMLIKSLAIFTLVGSHLLCVSALTKISYQRFAYNMRPNSYASLPIVTQKSSVPLSSYFNLYNTVQRTFFTPPNLPINELKYHLSKIRNVMWNITNKFKHVIAAFLLAASLFISTPSAVFAAKSAGLL